MDQIGPAGERAGSATDLHFLTAGRIFFPAVSFVAAQVDSLEGLDSKR
jgi:hypothetical protein